MNPAVFNETYPELAKNEQLREGLGQAYYLLKKQQGGAALTPFQEETLGDSKLQPLFNELKKNSAKHFFAEIGIADEIRRKVVWDAKMARPLAVHPIPPKTETSLTFADSRFVQLQDRNKECWTLFNEYLKCSKPHGPFTAEANHHCAPERGAAHGVCPADWIDRFKENIQEGTWWGEGMPDKKYIGGHH
jgi:hypothetical protein